jgi:uncharacterized protein (DUF2267 family)
MAGRARRIRAGGPSAGRHARRAMNFEKHAAQGNEFVKDVAVAMGHPDDHAMVYRSIRAVFHALRARLTSAQSFHLIGHLPMALKAVYVDGWHPAGRPERNIRTLEDLVEEIMLADGRSASRDFPHERAAERAIRAVIGVLACRIPAGEIGAIERGLPAPLARFWRDAADRAVTAEARRAQEATEADPATLCASTRAEMELLHQQEASRTDKRR